MSFATHRIIRYFQRYTYNLKMESFVAKSIRIALVVAAYWFVSISMVFLNKYLLSSQELKLDAPFFVTWFQCVVTVAICGILSFLANMTKKFTFPEFVIDMKILKQVLPLSIVFVSMITLNNLCLKYVGVAFYYIGRSLSTVCNVIFCYIILKQGTSWKAIACCALIVAGFMLGVDQEGVAGSLSIVGVAFGVGASMAVALYAIYTKKVLPVVEDNIWKLALYNNVNACFLFLPLILIGGEVPTIIHFEKLYSLSFWFMMSMAGIFGFAIGYVTGLQIQVTSPLTHNISGTAKACAQTVIATMYFNEQKPALWWVSNFVVLFGSGAYTTVKRSEMAKNMNNKQQEEGKPETDAEEGDAGPLPEKTSLVK